MEVLRRQYGLDQPMYVQYLTWISGFPRGDFGYSVEWKTPKPVRVGSKMDFVARFLGRRLAYTYEVRELIPDERLVMSTEEGPFPMETTYVWQDTPSGGTKMLLRNRGMPSGFSKVVAPMMRFAMHRANRKDLARIKEILESRRG